MGMFDDALAIVFESEGGFVNDKYDAGGKTKFGISAAQYPNLNIEALTKDDAKAIYRRDYWNKYRCGELPWCFAVALFDAVVNHHPENPIKWLQGAIGVLADGVIGPRTVAASHACRNKPEALATMLLSRLEHFQRQPNYERFKNGWRKRLYKLAMAAGTVPTPGE